MSDRLKKHWRARWAAYVTLWLALACAWLVYNRLSAAADQRLQQIFEDHHRRIISRISQDLDGFVQLMKGLRGMIYTHSQIHPKDLSDYLEHVNLRDPARRTGLFDVGLVWRVTETNRLAFSREMRQKGLPQFTFRASGLKEYFPLIFLEEFISSEAQQQVLGWDAGSEPRRREAMESARDTGTAVATRKIELVSPGRVLTTPGFIVYLPIYAGSVQPTSVAQRRELLRGYLFCSFSPKELWKDLPDKEWAGMLAFKVSQGPSQDLFYDRTPEAPADLSSPRRTSGTVTSCGRVWTVESVGLPAFEEHLRGQQLGYILFGSPLIVLALFLIAWREVSARLRAEALTRNLKDSESTLRNANLELRRWVSETRESEKHLQLLLAQQRATLEATADGILVVNRQGRMVGYNRRFVEMWGLPDWVLKSSDHEQAILWASQSMVDSEGFLARTRGICLDDPMQSTDEVWLKDGRIIERFSRVQMIGEESVGRVWSFRDSTMQRQARTALEVSEERYRTLVETSRDIVWSADLEGRLSYVNNASIRIHGYAASEMVGHSFADFQPLSDAGRYLEAFRHLLSVGVMVDFETQHLRKDGKPITLVLNAVLLKDSSGQPAAVTGTATDITLRKEAEERLRGSEELYQSLVDSLPHNIFRKDLEGRFTFANARYCETSGRALDEILGKTDWDLHPAEFAAKFRRDDRAVIESETMLDLVEMHPQSMGQTIYVHTIKLPIHDASGKVSGIQGVYWDVTDRKRSEDALAAEKERLSVTLRSITDGVITVDREGKILMMNEAGEKMTGWTQSEAARHHWRDVLAWFEEGSMKPGPDPFAQILQGGSARPGTVGGVVHSRDGTEWLLDARCSATLDREGNAVGAVLVLQDVGSRRELELELLKTSKLESIGVLAGGIAHDFNNILTAILGNLSLARLTQGLGAEVVDRLLGVEKAALRARDLTQQLLTFAKGGAPVKAVTCLPELVREAAEFVVRGSKVSCSFTFDQTLAAASIDGGQISQVVHNLVLNALQAMPLGGLVRVEGRNVLIRGSEVPPLRPGHYITISFSDEGVGIPKEHLAKIFDPYFSTRKGGNGLGLATAYSILRRHEGLLTVASVLGDGTTFEFYLPASDELPLRVVPSMPADLNGAGRILIMDDEEPIRLVLGAMLRMYGYEVEIACNGDEAVAKYYSAYASGAAFRAVIMDLTVPGGMGGKEATQRIREIDRRVKAIVSSGYSNDPVMAEYTRHGFIAMIEKPYRAEELARLLKEVLSSN